MRAFCLLFCMLMLTTAAFSQNQSLQGIQKSDMNLRVDPCADFYEYANGNWRAENPIPSSMTRWSRRWAAGEATKDHLKEIVEKRRNNPERKAATSS